MVLKNNRGVEDNRVRHLDYGVQVNKLMYERFINKENITLFSPHDVTDMYEAFFADQEKFEELYLKYEQDDSIVKKSIPARELFGTLMNERASTGRIYIQNVDHCNSHSAFRPEVAPIRMSNLCVSGDTEILTKEYGYIAISIVVNQDVHVWNGEEWSLTKIVQTSEDSEMLLVETHDGKSIKCTHYHRFFIECDEGIKEKRAYELKPGDKLIKTDWPVMHGSERLSNPYIDGYCCIEKLIAVSYNNDGTLKDKSVVPDGNILLKDRLNWLSAFLDVNAIRLSNSLVISCIGDNYSIAILKQIVKLLECTGVSGELIKKDASIVELIISGNAILKLKELGLDTRELKLDDIKYIQSEAIQSVITRITPSDNEPTFCFKEEKRGMGIFNGLLVSNCLEITLPTKPLSIKDREQGEISLCTLSAVNLGNLNTLNDLEERTDILVRFLDELLDYQEYPVYEAEKTTKSRRSLGIGVINYAYYLTKHFYTYDEKALELTHDTFEALQYYSLKSSMQLAKEKGKCAWFEDTTYSKGLLPIDTYKKDLDEVYPPSYKLDWEWLREEIGKYGLRNSTLTALMPSECQSKDNLLLLNDNTVKPLYKLLDESLGKELVELVETNGIPQRFPVKPIVLSGNREVTEVYYNGIQEMFEIELEDGNIYKFTGNHLLAVNTTTSIQWKRVDELTEETTSNSIKIKRISKLDTKEHTWDVSTNTDDYILSNGIISHNTSSQIANATNGIEPPRGLVSIKQSKDGIIKQVVPEVDKFKSIYPLLWNLPDNHGYLILVAVMQKFVDQSISANTNYDPSKFKDRKVPLSQMLKDLLLCYKLGIKTLYYHNTRDGANDAQDNVDDCVGGACKI